MRRSILKDVVVIGGGASGMFCAILLAERGCRVTVIEKNEKTGKKLYITGKGRCNLTNSCTEEEFLRHVVSNPKFLYSAIYHMNPERVIRLFSEWGLQTKTERGRRVFPVSDHASDVILTLNRRMKALGVKVLLNTKVIGIWKDENGIRGVRVSGRAGTLVIPCDAAVLAAGGRSYPTTGSSGDGYRFAEELGLRVNEIQPSLVPLVCPEEYVHELQGLSLKNVTLSIKNEKKELFCDFGEMMFTHFGMTGPLVLSASAVIGKIAPEKPLSVEIDLKPAVTEEQLDARLLRIFGAGPRKELRNALHELYPQKMVPVIPRIADIPAEKRVSAVTAPERKRIISVTKRFPLTVTAKRGFSEAIITKGGISVKEINPSTMEVRKIPGLYVIGEVLDVDALTGGYNLQIAWSTAALCAESCGGEGKR